MVEAKREAEGLPRLPPQQRQKRALIEGSIISVNQRAAGALLATTCERATVVLKDRSDAQESIVENEIVRRSRREPEQQVRYRRERRGLAGLVRAVDDVQVRSAGTEREFTVFEAAVTLEGQAGEAHL
ncbi:hypothetical protein D3C80_1870600 [compost metagenome]